MNVVALSKIVTWLCDIYLSLLICFGNYDMFLSMRMNLTCRSCQRTSNDSSPKASRVKDTMEKERDSKDSKENSRSTSIDEEHLGHEN